MDFKHIKGHINTHPCLSKCVTNKQMATISDN
jgi:hypothetical protein